MGLFFFFWSYIWVRCGYIAGFTEHRWRFVGLSVERLQMFLGVQVQILNGRILLFSFQKKKNGDLLPQTPTCRLRSCFFFVVFSRKDIGFPTKGILVKKEVKQKTHPTHPSHLDIIRRNYWRNYLTTLCDDKKIVSSSKNPAYTTTLGLQHVLRTAKKCCQSYLSLLLVVIFTIQVVCVGSILFLSPKKSQFFFVCHFERIVLNLFLFL